MALSSIPWAVYIVYCKALVRPRTVVGKACVGAVGRRLDTAKQKSKGRKLFSCHKCYETWMWGNTIVRIFYKWVLRVLVSENVHWADYFCFGITVWRGCYWHVHWQTVSWYSEPLNQLMESAVSIVLKLLALALLVGWHDDPRQMKRWCREREYQVWKVYILGNCN